MHPVGRQPDGFGGSTLDVLYRRVGEELNARGRGGYETWPRGRTAGEPWYVNVLHFAGPVDVERLVAWGDERRHRDFGIATLDAAKVVRYRYTGSGLRAETVHRAPLAGIDAG